MKINKIEKLKDNKYKLIIDDEELITFDNVILDNNLLYKKYIDNDLYNIILKDTEFYNIYNKTVKYILKKRRTEKEVNQYLLKFDLDEENIKKIIFKLKNNNLINDLEYAKAFINDNIYLSKNGINKIRIELLNQNIPVEIIENELNNIDKDLINNKLEKLIIKKINMNKKYSNVYLKQKILNEMINLGYDKDIILTILDANLNEDINIMKKEFEKIYMKLSKKYNGEELLKNVKNKMLVKGFSISNINELINEKTED